MPILNDTFTEISLLLPNRHSSRPAGPLAQGLLRLPCRVKNNIVFDGPLTRYVNLMVAHAPGMTRTFSPPPTSKETASYPSQHASRHVRDANTVMHVGIANPRWRGKRSHQSRRTRNTQLYVSVKWPISQDVQFMFSLLEIKFITIL